MSVIRLKTDQRKIVFWIKLIWPHYNTEKKFKSRMLAKRTQRNKKSHHHRSDEGLIRIRGQGKGLKVLYYLPVCPLPVILIEPGSLLYLLKF